MLCDKCQEREATHHIISGVPGAGKGEELGMERERHFCERCLDEYLSATPGMSPMRGLIRLSDSYRSKLYDLLAASHPEAFYAGEDYALNQQAGDAARIFLREQFQKEGIGLNEEAFQMLYCDFMLSYHFYTCRNKYNQRKG
jgi:hypothetical protein